MNYVDFSLAPPPHQEKKGCADVLLHHQLWKPSKMKMTKYESFCLLLSYQYFFHLSPKNLASTLRCTLRFAAFFLITQLLSQTFMYAGVSL